MTLAQWMGIAGAELGATEAEKVEEFTRDPMVEAAEAEEAAKAEEWKSPLITIPGWRRPGAPPAKGKLGVLLVGGIGILGILAMLFLRKR